MEKIKIERIVCGNVNCYILSVGEKAILVDTGRQKYREKVLNSCKPYEIQLILLTHGHVDHVQNAAFLTKELHAPIGMAQADMELLKDNRNQSLQADHFLGKIVLAASLKSFRRELIASFVPTIFLAEGDSLAPYGIDAEIIAVEGHTMGSIAVDVGKKYVLVGDALMNMFYPTVAMLYHDREQMLASAEKISNLGERTIYFGHGKPVNNKNWLKNRR